LQISLDLSVDSSSLPIEMFCLPGDNINHFQQCRGPCADYEGYEPIEHQSPRDDAVICPLCLAAYKCRIPLGTENLPTYDLADM
jgi:hypothetical protein